MFKRQCFLSGHEHHLSAPGGPSIDDPGHLSAELHNLRVCCAAALRDLENKVLNFAIFIIVS